MVKLKLRSDYLGKDTTLIVNEYSRNVVAIQKGGICHEPHRPALSTNDLAQIVSKILEENRHFDVRTMTSTIDGAIICFKQILPIEI